MPQPLLTDDELFRLRAILASHEAERAAQVAAEAEATDREARRLAARDALDERQSRLRTEAAAVPHGSTEYRRLVRVGDAEVSALIEAVRSI